MVAAIRQAAAFALCGLLLASGAHAEPTDDRFHWTPDIRITAIADDEPDLEDGSDASADRSPRSTPQRAGAAVDRAHAAAAARREKLLTD